MINVVHFQVLYASTIVHNDNVILLYIVSSGPNLVSAIEFIPYIVVIII